MERYAWVLAGLVVMVLSHGCGTGPSSLPATRPNILLILADDLGYSDLGVHGNSLLETPNLDRLAAESVQFSQFYVTPVCATTRASLLTGRHFLRTGVSHVHGGKDFLHLDEVTLADKLKRKGYATGMWGKWHSGKTPGYFPWERGFDEAFMAALYRHEDNAGYMNGEKLQTSGWTTDVLTGMAIDFMERNRDRPFFAYLPFLACHAPLRAPGEYTARYLEKGLSENLSTLYGMVDQMDDNVGRLLAALEELGLSEKTVVLFLSDNGPAVLNGTLTPGDRRVRYVNGLRGHKGNIWENGIRSPLFVRWKGHFTPGVAGCLTDVTDLFPTLLELAGGDSRAERRILDGRSILPYLAGEEGPLPGKEVFLYANPGWPPSDRPWSPEGVKDEYRPWKYGGGSNLSYEAQIMGVRGERYKLLYHPGPTDGTIQAGPSGYVLLDMKEDPKEQNNLVTSRAGVADSMKTSLRGWYQRVFTDEHAFEMPVFLVNGEPGIAYPVLPYGPRTTSQGVQGASNYISGFCRTIDTAEYTIDVSAAGDYSLEIRYRLDGDAEVECLLAFPSGTCPVTFRPAERSVHVGEIRLSDEIVNFTVSNADTRPGSDLRLYEMYFRRSDNGGERIQ